MLLKCFIIASPAIIALISLPLAKDGSTWFLNPWVAFLISLSSVFSGTLLAVLLIHKSRQRQEDVNKKAKRHTHCEQIYEGGFSDIIRDGNYYASLPRFQFLLWTFVISFTFLSVYLIRILGGEYSFPAQIPTEVLLLMGISVTVPTISTPLSSFKYDSTLAQKPPCKEEITPVSDMLLESGKPALFRYQMFLWTLVAIGIYLLVFFSQAIGTINNHPIIQNQILSCIQLDIQRTAPNVNATLKSDLDTQFHTKCDAYPKPLDKNKTLKEFSLPNIDPSLVILTGLSQGGFLGGKLVTRTPIKIERVVMSGINKTLIIFGSNFLTTGGTVLINGDKDYRMQKGVATWADSMIEVSVDDDTVKNWRTVEVITTEATQARYQREAPYVDYTQPYDGAKNVPVDIKKVLAVFSEPIKLETFTPDKFMLRTKDGRVTINGKVSYDETTNTANFDLLEHLCTSTEYIATIDSSVTDEVGIHMEKDEIWSFTTSKTPTPTPTLTPTPTRQSLRPFDKNKTSKELSLPTIYPSLVILTGISQCVYLAGKLVGRTHIRIKDMKGLFLDPKHNISFQMSHKQRNPINLPQVFLNKELHIWTFLIGLLSIMLLMSYYGISKSRTDITAIAWGGIGVIIRAMFVPKIEGEKDKSWYFIVLPFFGMLLGYFIYWIMFIVSRLLLIDINETAVLFFASTIAYQLMSEKTRQLMNSFSIELFRNRNLPKTAKDVIPQDDVIEYKKTNWFSLYIAIPLLIILIISAYTLSIPQRFISILLLIEVLLLNLVIGWALRASQFIRKDYAFYFAKTSVVISNNIGSRKEKESEAEMMNYLITGLDAYNRFLRRNLNLEIKDIRKIYSRLTSASSKYRRDFISTLKEAFEETKLGNDAKLQPIIVISSYFGTSNTEELLVNEQLAQKIKDLGTFLAVIIPIIISLYKLFRPV